MRGKETRLIKGFEMRRWYVEDYLGLVEVKRQQKDLRNVRYYDNFKIVK